MNGQRIINSKTRELCNDKTPVDGGEVNGCY